jgi:hypothetical protein
VPLFSAEQAEVLKKHQLFRCGIHPPLIIFVRLTRLEISCSLLKGCVREQRSL